MRWFDRRVRPCCRFFGVLVVVIALSGCLVEDPPEALGEQADEADYEVNVIEEKITGRTTLSPYIQGRSQLSFTANNGQVIGAPSWSFERPRHLHEARIEIEWESEAVTQSQVFRLVVGSLLSPWNQTIGESPLETVVKNETWGEAARMPLGLMTPEDHLVDLHAELSYTLRVAFVQHIPLVEDEEEEEGKGRGSNTPP